VEIVKPTFQWRTSRIQQVSLFLLFYLILSTVCVSSLTNSAYTVAPHLSGLIVTTSQSDMQKIRIILYFYFKFLGNSPVSEFYMPTFRNTLSVPSS
jgi:hypothetical protein